MAAAQVNAEQFEKLSKDLQAEYGQPDEQGWRTLVVQPTNGLSLDKNEDLKKALSSERGARSEKEKALNTYVDDEGKPLDPARARSAMKKAKEMDSWTPSDKAREQLEAMKVQLEEKHGAEAKTLQEKIAKMEKGLHKAVKVAALNSAIAKAKGRAPLLVPALERMVDVREDPHTGEFRAVVLDESGNERMSLRTGSREAMSVEEFVESFKSNPDYQPAFDGTGTSGSGGVTPGAGGVGGGVPGAGGRFQITAKEARENFPKYRDLQKQASAAGQTVAITEA